MDWSPIIIKALDQAPVTIAAVGTTAGIFYKIMTRKLKPVVENQQDIKKDTKALRRSSRVMKKQLDGHTKMLAEAKEAQGIVKGYQRAKKDARYDRRELTKIRKRAIRATNGRRGSDKKLSSTRRTKR